MAAKSERTAANFRQVSAFLDTINFYPINLPISKTYGSLKGKLVATFGPRDKTQQRDLIPQNLGFGDNDLWIAATATYYNLTMVSTDNDFQRMQKVEPFAIESWV